MSCNVVGIRSESREEVLPVKQSDCSSWSLKEVPRQLPVCYSGKNWETRRDASDSTERESLEHQMGLTGGSLRIMLQNVSSCAGSVDLPSPYCNGGILARSSRDRNQSPRAGLGRPQRHSSERERSTSRTTSEQKDVSESLSYQATPYHYRSAPLCSQQELPSSPAESYMKKQRKVPLVRDDW